MCCVLLVVLLSFRQHNLECDIQKIWEICTIYGQPAIEKSLLNMFIAMHIALDRNRPQMLSREVRACGCNDWGNANAFFLPQCCYLGNAALQHILPSFGRCQLSFGNEILCMGIVQIFIWHPSILGTQWAE